LAGEPLSEALSEAFAPRVRGPAEIFELSGLRMACPIAARVQCTPFTQGEAAHAELLRTRAQRRRQAILRAAGVPERYLDVQLEGARQTAAIDAVRGWLGIDSCAGRALLLLGPTGTGKTFAVVAALAAVAERSRLVPPAREDEPSRLVHFAMAGAWLRQARAFRHQQEAWDLVHHTRLVVLDDLSEPRDAHDAGAVDELVAIREAAGRPLLITSNLTIDAIRSRYSDRIVDRLRAWARLHQCSGDSLREAATP